MDNGLPVVVFALMGEGNVVRAIRGEEVGTLICRQAGRDEDDEDPRRPRPRQIATATKTAALPKIARAMSVKASGQLSSLGMASTTEPNNDR